MQHIKIIKKLLEGGLAGLLLGMAMPVYANDAIVLLNQMNQALRDLQYEGRLVYLKDGEVSTLSVFHHLENGAEKEVIVPLDSNGDEFIRESQSFSLSNLPPQITEDMKAVYSFDIGGMSKVAGRDCRLVLARPKDRKRYLQKFCIDSESSLLLRYTLINQRHEPVERFMFADIQIVQDDNLRAEMPTAASAPPALASSVEPSSMLRSAPLSKLSAAPVNSLAEVGVAEAKPAATVASPNHDSEVEGAIAKLQKEGLEQTSAWFFDPLPAGFKLLNYPKSNIADGEEHIVLSDGLSSVSVFIGENVAKSQNHVIQSGALNILIRKKEDFAITLVGEVPRETLEEIFAGLRHVQPANSD